MSRCSFFSKKNYIYFYEPTFKQMCGRYGVVSSIPEIQTRFEVSLTEGKQFERNYNISPGDFAPVITQDNPDKLQLFRFGLMPFWAKKPMYLFNARSEGDFNKENARDYQGEKGIVHKPAFRKPIRTQRCLIPANYFVEGTTKEKLDKPHVVYINNLENLFSFAGIWDTWINQNTGELIQSFSIITTTPNPLLAKIPHHRSPVILNSKDEKRWISRDTSLMDIVSLLCPRSIEQMHIYPIDKAIKNPRVNGNVLIQSVGSAITE